MPVRFCHGRAAWVGLSKPVRTRRFGVGVAVEPWVHQMADAGFRCIEIAGHGACIDPRAPLTQLLSVPRSDDHGWVVRRCRGRARVDAVAPAGESGGLRHRTEEAARFQSKQYLVIGPRWGSASGAKTWDQRQALPESQRASYSWQRPVARSPDRPITPWMHPANDVLCFGSIRQKNSKETKCVRLSLSEPVRSGSG